MTIIKAEDLPEKEVVYLKKSRIFNEWAVVRPHKNEDGSINWFNLIIGGWGNLAVVLLIVLMLAMFYMAYGEVSTQLETCVSNYNSLQIIPDNMKPNLLNLPLP